MYVLENEVARVEFKTMGAEIISFILKAKQMEAIWSGDPTYWSGRNPILFPIVGSTFSKDYQIDGKTYSMGNHGFARNSEFVVVHHLEDRILFALNFSAETLAQYPFEFKLTVEYVLQDCELTVNYNIFNLSEKVMPFSFGLHPAFNCPLAKGEKFEDYYLEFASVEDCTTLKGDFKLKGNKIALNYEIFKSIPTLLFESIKSPYVTLTNGVHGVKVTVQGYRWLAFWTKQEAPYLCIEPWHGHGDFKANDVPFEQREGTICLNPDKSFTTTYQIKLF